MTKIYVDSKEDFIKATLEHDDSFLIIWKGKQSIGLKDIDVSNSYGPLPPAEYLDLLVKSFADSAFTSSPSIYWGYLLDQAEKHVAIQNEVMEGKSIEDVSPFPILRFHVATGEVTTEWIEWADDMFSDDTEEACTIWPHDPDDPHEFTLDILAEYEYRFISK